MYRNNLNLFSITALAASGGTGVLNSEPSKGAYVNAKFNLTEGEEIYMLVGQRGESACSPVRARTEHSRHFQFNFNFQFNRLLNFPSC